MARAAEENYGLTRFRHVLLVVCGCGAALLAGAQASEVPEPTCRLALASDLTGRARDHSVPASLFRRASPATWWDDERQCLQEAAPDVPRFEYRPGKPWGAPQGVLLEPPATNLLPHSSFENGGERAWKVSGRLTVTAVPGGVHGNTALRVVGTGRLYQEMDLPVQNAPPFHNSFALSFFCRQEDGGLVAPWQAAPMVAGKVEGPTEILAADTQHDWKGRGPWVRISSRFGPNGQRLEQAHWLCGIQIATSEPLLVDAVQLEQGLGQNYVSTATSYIPTEDRPVQRAADALEYKLRPFVRAEEGTAMVWVYQPDPPVPNGYFLSLHGTPPYAFLTYLTFTFGGTGTRLMGEHFPAGGRWTHLAGTWQGAPAGEMRLFVNGREPVNREEGPVPYPGPVLLDEVMALSRPSAEPLGLLADLMLFDRALSRAQVRSVFRTGIASSE